MEILAAALYALGLILVALFVRHELSGSDRSWSTLPREDRWFAICVGLFWPLAVIVFLLMVASGLYFERKIRSRPSGRP